MIDIQYSESLHIKIPALRRSSVRHSRVPPFLSEGVSSMKSIAHRNYVAPTLGREGVEKLSDFPYLRASIEDALAAQATIMSPNPCMRHAIVFMHDAIEFIIYESLVSCDVDIYENGQNTVGINSAIALYSKKYGDPPFIGTLRTIQKLRGDAKHHAQVPEESAISRISSEFTALMSCLTFRHFGEVLVHHNIQTHFLPLHAALFVQYRKYRNRNWERAATPILGALMHGIRHTFELKDDFSAYARTPNEGLIAIVRESAHLLKHRCIEDPDGDISTMNTSLASKNFRELSETAARIYSLIQRRSPSNFDLATSRHITPQLVQPKLIHYLTSISLTKVHHSDTSVTKISLDDVRSKLRSCHRLVEELGAPYREDDEDRYWIWWELAIFAGGEWHTFHLHNDLQISLEVGGAGEDSFQRREQVAVAILTEISSAVVRGSCTSS